MRNDDERDFAGEEFNRRLVQEEHEGEVEPGSDLDYASLLTETIELARKYGTAVVRHWLRVGQEKER